MLIFKMRTMSLVIKRQQIDGILLLNKHSDVSSNKALQQVKKLFGAKKAGHTGTLDPMATGLLPLCFGEATKVCSFLLDADKIYQARGVLGIKTDTGDITGTVLNQAEPGHVSMDSLNATLSAFCGQISQKPSMFSALKHQGRPLYEYARKGIEIERKHRDIYIHELKLIGCELPYFDIYVRCSKGTYIRNLIDDIGEALGCGAAMASLHRLGSAGLEGYPMYTLEDLEEMMEDERLSRLLPMDSVLMHLPELSLNPEQALYIRQGRVIAMDAADGFYRAYDDGVFMGLIDVSQHHAHARRLLSTDNKQSG